MAAKHTPGPWKVDPAYLSEVQTADEKTIASCWHEHADGAQITVTGVLACGLEESAANARLIASAPDLLAALKELLAETEANTCQHESLTRGGAIWTICTDCGRKWADDDGGFVPTKDTAPVAKARAAIRQAEGGE